MSPALRVRGTDWDLRRAKGIMASGAGKGRMTGRTHGRTDQQRQMFQKILANVGPSTHGLIIEGTNFADIRKGLWGQLGRCQAHC